MHASIHLPLFYRWKRARLAAACGVPLHCGPTIDAERSAPGASSFFGAESTGGFAGGAFGVRRPLRLLAYKLGLSDAQVAEMARILNDLKTEGPGGCR